MFFDVVMKVLFIIFSQEIFLIVMKNFLVNCLCVLVIRVELKGSYLEKP